MSESENTQMDIFIKIEEIVELFHDQYKQPYAKVEINGTNKVFQVGANDFKGWIRDWYRNTYNKVMGSTILNNIIEDLKFKAKFDCKENKLFNRVAKLEQDFWYDLSSENGQAIKIEPSGKYEIIDNPPIIFRSYQHQQPQVKPSSNPDIHKIFKYINLPKDQELLFLSYLVSCFIPDIPHPVCVIYGEKGAAKTTTLKIIKKLVDPSLIESMGIDKNKNGLIQKLDHHYWVGFDNVSEIQRDVSDTFCRAVTGDGFSKRSLYSNDDEFIYEFQRCIGLNGINLEVKEADLLDRSLIFELNRIDDSERKESAYIWDQFSKDKPDILAGIFLAIRGARKMYSKIEIESPSRMADFNRWGCAIALALYKGKREGGELFQEQYRNNREHQNEELIKENSLLTLLIGLLDEQEKGQWYGKVSDLLEELKLYAIKKQANISKEGWYKQANQLSRKLKEYKSNINQAGIEFEFKKKNDGSYVHFNNNDKSSPPSPLNSIKHDILENQHYGTINKELELDYEIPVNDYIEEAEFFVISKDKFKVRKSK